MSGLRGLVPATVAIGLGIFTGVNKHSIHCLSAIIAQALSSNYCFFSIALGYYTFHPAIQQFNAERRTMNP